MLQGKVAQILNERELVINLGTDSGVMRGTKFAVLAETPTEIVDPDTGQPLGVLDREKVRVEAREIHEGFTICVTYEKRVVGGLGLGILNSDLLQAASPRREIPVTLKLSDHASLPPLPVEESYVKIGDRVKEIRP